MGTQTRIAYVWASSSDENTDEDDDEELGRRRHRRPTGICQKLLHRLISLVHTLRRVVRSEGFKDRFCSWLREACIACLYFALLLVFIGKQWFDF